MRRGAVPLWLAIALVVAPAAIAWADIYSYTDADGVIHFTNIKPAKKGRWKKVMKTEPDRGTKAAAARGSCERCDKVPSRDNSPERFTRYDAYIEEAADLYKIPTALIRAVIKSESDYDPNVVSAMDAKGLMQLMPEVEQDMGVTDVFDPRQNILGGTRLLRILANKYDGDLVLTIAAYHAGAGSLAKYGNTVQPYEKTRQYLETVLARYHAYKAKE
jgi:soluble lytic murein transglycosylase-like protein